MWAQFRTLRNRLPRANKLGLALAILIGAIWYGIFASIAAGAATLMADDSQMSVIASVLPGGLLLAFLYWVLVPALMASKGSSLELRKLVVYPVPSSEFWRLEMLLRLSVGIEPMLVIAGAFVGLLLNRAIPRWAPWVLWLFVLFTMCVAIGIHDLLARLMARKGVREVVALLFLMLVALPQALLMRGGAGRYSWMFHSASWIAWPWGAAARIAIGHGTASNLIVLLLWTAAAYAFGRWQFQRTLAFDASDRAGGRSGVRSRLEWMYQWPNILFHDPLAALVEKDMRFLSRASRFRMAFVMGFSFGVIIWWPAAFGNHERGGTFISGHFITVVSLYAVLLLTDVLFYNAFGFDRAATQLYFVVPIPVRTVILAKNVAALFFVALETAIATLICAVLRLPLTAAAVGEAYCVTAVAALMLLSLGNIASLYSPRSSDPAKTFRSGRGGRVQAVMLLSFPIVTSPVWLAFLARYALNSELAFYMVLLCGFALGIVIHRVSLDYAVRRAENNRESFLAALSGGEGLIEA